MAIFSINIKNALQTNAFEFGRQYRVDSSQEDHPAEYWTKPRDKSYLGTPLFMPLEIKGGSYTDETGQTITFDGIFIDCVLITVSEKKLIEKTQITGRKGTIKEYIADGDFDVDIKIVLASPHANIFPEEAHTRMINILRAPIALEVVSPVLNYYEIYNLVVEDYSNPQRPGFQNLSLFDVKTVSDEPLELRLINQ